MRITVVLYMLMLFQLVLAEGWSQVYPVQVTTQLRPPYSPYLTDLTTPGPGELILHIRANDQTLHQYPFSLRITIEGAGISLRTRQNLQVAPLLLSASGVSEVFYGQDLAAYFQPGAFDVAGIDKHKFERDARLPEGVYRFSVQVLDRNRGTVVSNNGTTTAWIIMNDPPLLNMPIHQSTLNLTDPVNILFTWTPRHTGSPNAAFATEYTFRLIELWSSHQNSNDAFLNQVPLFETTTVENFFLYGVSGPSLLPGRRYAWQVQARDTGGKDLFRNNGRSEVFHFQFGDVLDPPRNIRLMTAQPTALTIRWEPPSVTARDMLYRIRYRPTGQDSKWYEAIAAENRRTLTSLKPVTQYEVMVKAETPVQESDYSAPLVIKTLRHVKNEFVCTENIKPPALPANSVPLFHLSVNDTIHAGGYDVLVRDVIEMGGKYYGSGVAIVPWFNSAKVRVTFEKIAVNKRFSLTSGTIQSVWRRDSKFLLDVETPLTPSHTPEAGELDITVVAADTLITITGTAIAAVTRDTDGNIVLLTTDGKETVLTAGESYALADDAGNGYITDLEGNIVKTTAAGAHAAASRGKRTLQNIVQFEKGSARYGFDRKQHDALSHYYQRLADGTFASWKALSSGGTDVVYARLTEAVERTNVRFEHATQPVTAAGGDGMMSLHLQGHAPGREDELLALFSPTDSLPPRVIGKINVVTYAPRQFNLVLVPVNNATLPAGTGPEDIQSYLNGVFGQAVVNWQVALEAGITVPQTGSLDPGEAGLISNYTPAMKEILRSYGPLRSDTYYLFLVRQAANSATLGYMPRNRQAGFVFTETLEARRGLFLTTIAHELGHGAFSLHHTFHDHPLPPASTDNLMDYAGGDQLYKYQWDQIHHPRGIMALFDAGEASESVVVTNMAQLKSFANPDGSLTFLAPTGIPFTLPASTQSVTFWVNDSYSDGVMDASEAPDGALIGFTIDHAKYHYFKVTGQKNGSGYKTRKGEAPYTDMLSKSQQGLARAIIGLPCFENGTLRFLAQQVRFETAVPSANYTAEGPVVAKLPIENPYDHHFSSAKIPIEATLDFQYTEEAKQFISENQACQNEMARYVIKGADIIQLHPGYYAKYKACTETTLEYPRSGASENQNAVALGIYYEKLKEFPDSFLSYIHQAKGVYQKILSISNPNELGALLNSTCETDYSVFTLEQRTHIVALLAHGSLQDYWLGLGNDRENMVIRALRQAPVEQHADLLAMLKREQYKLLKTLYAKCDNQVIGQDNLDKLVDAITVMVQTAHQYENFERDVSQDRILRWGSGGYFHQFVYECSDWTGNTSADIEFTCKSLNLNITGTGEYTGSYVSTSIAELPPVRAEPFDYVTLKLYSDASHADGTSILKKSAGEIQAVPALYLYWMLHRKATDETLASIKAAVNTGLFFFGGAEIMAARTGWRLAFAIADQSLFATSFVLDAGIRKKLEEGPDGLQWRALFKTFDAFNLTYGAFRLGQGITMAASLVLDQRQALAILKARASWNALTPSEQNIVRDQIGRVEKGMDELQSLTRQKVSVTILVPDLPSPVGKFRQLIGLNGRTYRAADFWNTTDDNFRLVTSHEGRYLIKHDPATGRMLFADVENKAFIGFALDEENLINNDYDALLLNLKTIHGLPGGARTLTVKGTTLQFSQEKANFILGKYDPNNVPGVSGEIGTDDIIKELSILKNYSFADRTFELRPGSVHVLNIPEKMAGTKPFFDTYNKAFLDRIIVNESEANVILASNPLPDLMRRFDGQEPTKIPTGFAMEIRYLRDHGVTKVHSRSGQTITLNDINLTDLNWNEWKY